jgi:acyl-CoA thioesterase-1
MIRTCSAAVVAILTVTLKPTASVIAAGPAGASSPPTVFDADLIVYALGDSTVVGMGARSGSYAARVFSRLEKTRRGRSRLINLAESGATTEDLLRDQLPRVRPAVNTLVMIGVGANDLTSGVTPKVFGQRFEALLTALQTRLRGSIVVSNVPDVSQAPAVWPTLQAQLAARVDVYNAIVESVARKHAVVVYDVCAMTRRTLAAHPEYLSGDGYHPSDAGYEAWADGLWPIVKRAL